MGLVILEYLNLEEHIFNFYIAKFVHLARLKASSLSMCSFFSVFF